MMNAAMVFPTWLMVVNGFLGYLESFVGQG